MLKVLFLDIDGVVLSGEDWGIGKGARYLPPAKIALVKEVCDRAGAVIVISSTWRSDEDLPAQLAHVGLTCLHPDWRTDQEWRAPNGLLMGELRGNQIQRWLDAHPEVGGYAIVDDDSDMLSSQMDHFVHSSFETGITRELADDLVRVLAMPILRAA